MATSSKIYSVLTEDSLFNGLTELREKKLCDVSLGAEDEIFPFHRVVLAAASPYFQAMFTGGFREKELDVIPLQETNVQGLKLVLDAIYTSKLVISNDSVDKILTVTHMYQMKAIVAACENYLCDNNTENNCVTFRLMAEKFKLERVVDVSDQFIVDNFEDVKKIEEFNKLTQGMLH